LFVDFQHSHADDPKTLLLKHVDNVTCGAFGYGVGFYD
jgi:hypothetical protein